MAGFYRKRAPRYGHVERMCFVVSSNASAEGPLGHRKLGTAAATGGLQAVRETPEVADP